MFRAEKQPSSDARSVHSCVKSQLPCLFLKNRSAACWLDLLFASLCFSCLQFASVEGAKNKTTSPKNQPPNVPKTVLSSSVEFQRLRASEKSMVRGLHDYIQSEQERLRKLNAWVSASSSKCTTKQEQRTRKKCPGTKTSISWQSSSESLDKIRNRTGLTLIGCLEFQNDKFLVILRVLREPDTLPTHHPTGWFNLQMNAKNNRCNLIDPSISFLWKFAHV